MNMISGENHRSIEDVRAGMQVVDKDGEVVGTVKDVLVGDPDAVTATVLGPEASVGRGPAVPHADRARMLREGYVVVKHRGLVPRQRFAAADEIAEVHGDVVQLNVPGRRLVG